jgi:NAD(P)-dependent dehydrogenase (short-subunit alcohol dehydrogenase family)
MASLGLICQTAREVASEGIRLNAIGTGSFEAGIADRHHDKESMKDPLINSIVTTHKAPSNRSGQPEEVSNVAAFLISEIASICKWAMSWSRSRL